MVHSRKKLVALRLDSEEEATLALIASDDGVSASEVFRTLLRREGKRRYPQGVGRADIRAAANDAILRWKANDDHAELDDLVHLAHAWVRGVVKRGAREVYGEWPGRPSDLEGIAPVFRADIVAHAAQRWFLETQATRSKKKPKK